MGNEREMNLDIEVLHLLTWSPRYGSVGYWDFPKESRDWFDLQILISLGKLYMEVVE